MEITDLNCILLNDNEIISIDGGYIEAAAAAGALWAGLYGAGYALGEACRSYFG